MAMCPKGAEMESDLGRLGVILRSERLPDLQDAFQSLSVDDLLALQSFPSHPHLVVHVVLSIVYVVLFEAKNPSFYKLTWLFLRDSLLHNAAALLHRLHARLRQLSKTEGSPLPLQVARLCLVYLDDPAYQLPSVRKVSSIAAALESWAYLCLATIVPPCENSRHSELPSRGRLDAPQQCFRHVERKRGQLYLTSTHFGAEHLHPPTQGLGISSCDAAAAQYAYTYVPAHDRRFASLLVPAIALSRRALHSLVAQAAQCYRWPHASHLASGVQRVQPVVLRCYFVSIAPTEGRISDIGVVYVAATTTLAQLRAALSSLASFCFVRRGSRVSRLQESRLLAAHVLPLAVLVLDAVRAPRAATLAAIELGWAIGARLNQAVLHDPPTLVTLPHTKVVRVGIDGAKQELVAAILNEWTERGYDAVVQTQQNDASSLLHLCLAPPDKHTERAVSLYLAVTLQSLRPNEWRCCVESPCPISAAVQAQLEPGARLRLNNGMDVVVLPPPPTTEPPFDIRFVFYVRHAFRVGSGWPETTNVWALVPEAADARPQWLADLEFHVRHPTIEFATSPLHFSFFRLRLQYGEPEALLEAAFWSQRFDWTAYIAATPCDEMLRAKYAELCDTYPANFFVDSVKFSKFIRDCHVAPAAIPIGTLDRIFAMHTSPVFRYQMEIDGFLAAMDVVVAELFHGRELHPIRHFVLHHLILDPHSRVIWRAVANSSALERYRTQAKADLMRSLAMQLCAATRLQAVFRGHVVYTQYQHHLAALRRRRRAVLVVQSALRMWRCMQRYVILLAAERERRRLAAIEAERLRLAELHRRFVEGRCVRLQRWVRHRLGWKGLHRKLHPEWVAHCQRLKSRARRFVDRFASYVDGRLVIVSVFRCHVDPVKDRRLHLELYTPPQSSTYKMDVHVSFLSSVWATVDAPSKAALVTLRAQLRLLLQRVHVCASVGRLKLHATDAAFAPGRRLAHSACLDQRRATVVEIFGANYDYVLLLYDPRSSRRTKCTLDAALVYQILQFMQYARRVLWSCCDVPLWTPQTSRASCRFAVTHALDCATKRLRHAVLQAIVHYMHVYGPVEPTKAMLPDAILARQVKQEGVAKKHRAKYMAAARTVQAAVRGWLARNHFARHLATHYDAFFDPDCGQLVYYNLHSATVVKAPPLHRLYPRVVFNCPTNEWQEQVDAATGRLFYYNPARGVSTWLSQEMTLQRMVRRRLHRDIGRLSLILVVHAVAFHTDVPAFAVSLSMSDQQRCAMHLLVMHQFDKAYRIFESILSAVPEDVVASVGQALLLLASGRHPQAKNHQRALRLLHVAKQRDTAMRDVAPLEDVCFRWPVLSNPSDALVTTPLVAALTPVAQALGLYALYVQHILEDLDRAETLFRRALFAAPSNEALINEYEWLKKERSPQGLYAASGPSKVACHRSLVIAVDGDWQLRHDGELNHAFWVNTSTKQTRWDVQRSALVEEETDVNVPAARMHG
ncbi:hypothetical protein ACHHYP_10468 [Achlya hypogyna]|uniref:WW domain-containing protein n=1 Tax=Achlya hypogyna TaxID=1202772 RepID=A0A1V9YLC4_ACHHY|nr:hypothetical protein ACHHYP_10468 [Achlya hypogyna]